MPMVYQVLTVHKGCQVLTVPMVCQVLMARPDLKGRKAIRGC